MIHASSDDRQSPRNVEDALQPGDASQPASGGDDDSQRVK